MGERIDTDAVLHRAMVTNHLEDAEHPVGLEGPTYRTERATQDQERSLPHFLLEEVGKHRVAHPVLHALDAVAQAIVGAGEATIKCAFKTMGEGDDLNAAVKREYAIGAALALCVDELPPGFRASVARGFVQPGVASPGAVQVYATLQSQPGADDIRAGIQANCRDGQQYALAKGIATAADLATALRQNPELAHRYQGDLAFKLGTDSVIWATANGGLPALQGQLPPAAQPRAIEVHG
jgi:hypothetical protein